MANDIVSANKNLSVAQRSGGFQIVPQSFGEVMEFARAMALSGVAVPKHLRGNDGACMAVAMQAFEWGMSAFSVANKSYSVNDRIAYEAQLIASVVNTRSGIQGRLKYAYEGDGDERRCIVTGKLDGEILEYKSPKFRDIHPKNSPLWKSDPDQQQGYYSARAWARRHVPEVILGVYDRDELTTIEAEDNDPPPAGDVVEGEIVRSDTPAIENRVEDRAFGAFDTLGDFMDALDQALRGAKDAAEIEEAWSEFDPMATLEGDDDAQELAVRIKTRATDQIKQKPKAQKKEEAPSAPADDDPPSAGLFSDD